MERTRKRKHVTNHKNDHRSDHINDHEENWNTWLRRVWKQSDLFAHDVRVMEEISHLYSTSLQMIPPLVDVILSYVEFSSRSIYAFCNMILELRTRRYKSRPSWRDINELWKTTTDNKKNRSLFIEPFGLSLHRFHMNWESGNCRASILKVNSYLYERHIYDLDYLPHEHIGNIWGGYVIIPSEGGIPRSLSFPTVPDFRVEAHKNVRVAQLRSRRVIFVLKQ